MIRAHVTRMEAAGTALLRRPGTGAAVLLLHGIGSDAESWAPLMAALPADLDATAWWAPGYGASAPVAPAAPAPGDYAARLLAVLDALGLPRAVLVGHSLGCLFAAAFAARHPGRVAALALLSPALGYGVPPDEALPAAVQARIDDLAALGPARFAEARAPRLLHRPEAQPEVLAAVRRGMAAARLPGYAQAARALGAGCLVADAGLLRAPALVACGAEDAVTPPANARRLHAALPAGSALHIVPEAGHALPQEKPADVAALLQAWMAEAAHAG